MSNGATSTRPPGPTGAKDSTSTESKVQDAAGQAQEKAQQAAGKAQKTLQEQVEQRAKKAGEQVTGTAEDLRSVGEELRKQGKEGPAKIADQAADRTEKVGSYLSGTGPDQMLHDVEDFGRQRPWALLAGGLALGALSARFLKASSRGRYQQRSASSGPSGPALGSGQTQPPAPPRESADAVRRPADGEGVAASTPPAPEPTGSPVIDP
jgi:hypothetical protein